LRRDFEQGLDRFACAIVCELLQPVAQRKEKEQRRDFGPSFDEKRTERDGDHQELNVYLAALERVPHILSGEPAAANISESKKRRGQLSADSCAVKEKTDKCAQSANRRQHQHDAVIAWHGTWKRT